jgi:hypothetical protein
VSSDRVSIATVSALLRSTFGDDAMKIVSTAYEYFLPEPGGDHRTVTAVTPGHDAGTGDRWSSSSLKNSR